MYSAEEPCTYDPEHRTESPPLCHGDMLRWHKSNPTWLSPSYRWHRCRTRGGGAGRDEGDAELRRRGGGAATAGPRLHPASRWAALRAALAVSGIQDRSARSRRAPDRAVPGSCAEGLPHTSWTLRKPGVMDAGPQGVQAVQAVHRAGTTLWMRSKSLRVPYVLATELIWSAVHHWQASNAAASVAHLHGVTAAALTPYPPGPDDHERGSLRQALVRTKNQSQP